MSRRGENIYKRKDNRWEGRYKKGRKSNGQLKYGYIYGKTYGEVKERLYALKLKYQTLIQLQGESALTYEEWGEIWLKQQQFTTKPSTYSAYLYKLTRYVFPIIGTTALNQITKQTIQTIIDTWQEQTLQPSTIQVLYQIMKKSLKDAHEQQQILTLPCQQIRLPKKKKPTVKALSTLEQQQLEKQAKALPLHKGLPVLLALNAGLRIGEISALRWEDIDLNNRMIYVKKTYQRLPITGSITKTQLVLDSSKTDQSIRVVPMTFSLYKYLKKWKKKAPGIFVCSNKTAPSEPRLLTYYFHRIRKMCGIPSTHFHHLRHTFATRCIEANGDIASVSKLLGHASTQTTLDVYTDSLVESRQRVIQQMEEKKEGQE
ncbi:tyrosine-type recombinase/integrase [Enterococcus sp. AZ126]|uniref:tyrosine-type recombinase/integrase n=1 Tax=Enterococcus sp. AZ126 TaxID=2774635 RepID=UPI003F281BBB